MALAERMQATPTRCLLRVLMAVCLVAAGAPVVHAGGKFKAASKEVVSDSVAAGRAIYLHGILTNGKPLVGTHADGMSIQGANTACVNCHQHSGLGAKEGHNTIPPITGRYLFRPIGRSQENLDLPFVIGMRPDRAPYTDETLARAVREGVDADGNALRYLMPRFNLDDADMVALIAYLRSLDQRKVPGVSNTVLHFATIITPDADPVKREGMLSVVRQFFADRNASQRAPSPRLLSTHKVSFKAPRQWQLHVWELKGPASTWNAQLKRYLEQEPVFAVLSGLGGASWAPVQAFCESEGIPCLFPNVEAPPAVDSHSFYSLYFSPGVDLEADLIARHILDSTRGSPTRTVTQVYRSGESGVPAATFLAKVLKTDGIRVTSHALPADAQAGDVADAVSAASGADAMVLWLHQKDIAALGAPPREPEAVFMSGLMGGLENAPLPADWRSRVNIAYPVDLPEQRRVRLDYPLGWFRFRRIPIVDLPVQVDTYLACGILSETLNGMSDTFMREYLVERVQNMLEHRILTGYFPRLSLATGQRFASKGGYIVKFAGADGNRLMAVSNWTVP